MLFYYISLKTSKIYIFLFLVKLSFMLLISCVLRSNYFGEVKWKKKKGGILVRQQVFSVCFMKIVF